MYRALNPRSPAGAVPELSYTLESFKALLAALYMMYKNFCRTYLLDQCGRVKQADRALAAAPDFTACVVVVVGRNEACARGPQRAT